MIPHCFTNVEVRALGRPIHDSIRYIFTAVVIRLGSLSYWKTKMLPVRCYFMVNQNLMVLLLFTISSNSQHKWNAALNLTEPPLCLYTDFEFCIHHSARPVVTDFLSSSCVIKNFKNSSFTATLPLRAFLMRLQRTADQVLLEVFAECFSIS